MFPMQNNGEPRSSCVMPLCGRSISVGLWIHSVANSPYALEKSDMYTFLPTCREHHFERDCLVHSPLNLFVTLFLTEGSHRLNCSYRSIPITPFLNEGPHWLNSLLKIGDGFENTSICDLEHHHLEVRPTCQLLQLVVKNDHPHQ